MPATLDSKPVRLRGIPLDQYSCEHDVAVFPEHERTLELRDGTEVTDTYGRKQLEWIIANQNRRIENTGDYVPIVIRHTEELDGTVHDAPVVGFAGPFRLGVLGDLEPKYCILAENWYIRRTDADLAAKYPRRSVELHRTKKEKDRFFDPISLLGAEVPYFDLGLMYSRRGANEGDEPVVCYSAAAVASGGNVFVPSWGEKKPGGEKSDESDEPEEPATVDYQLDPESPEGTDDMDGELSANAIKQIIDAWESTDYVQWTRGKMAEEQAANVTDGMPATPLAPDVPAAPVDPAAGGAVPGAAGAAAAPADPAAGGAPGDPATGAAPPAASDDGTPPGADAAGASAGGPPAADNDSDDDGPTKINHRRENRNLTVQYQRAVAERDAALAEKDAADAEVVRYRKVARDAARKSELSTLSLNYVVNVDEELARADAMEDAAFEDHLDTITQRYQRIPIGSRGLLPAAIASEPLAVPTQDSPAAMKDAKALRDFALAKGLSYEEAKVLYRKEKESAVAVAA